MESRLALDTHVALWLFTGKYDNISAKGIEYISNHALIVSPIVEMELQLLYEIGRTKYTADYILKMLNAEVGLEKVIISLNAAVDHSLQLTWTRDPFDRLIVATSLATQVPLLTKDRNILTNFDLAVW